MLGRASNLENTLVLPCYVASIVRDLSFTPSKNWFLTLEQSGSEASEFFKAHCLWSIYIGKKVVTESGCVKRLKWTFWEFRLNSGVVCHSFHSKTIYGYIAVQILFHFWWIFYFVLEGPAVISMLPHIRLYLLFRYHLLIAQKFPPLFKIATKLNSTNSERKIKHWAVIWAISSSYLYYCRNYLHSTSNYK